MFDVLVAEIGSTTTVVNAFDGMDGSAPRFLGQGQSRTTVEEGDVNLGLRAAMDSLRENLGMERLDYRDFLATSSAAGGLRMTVHGLVHDMTVKAAREAALGAGANLRMVTSGRLRSGDLTKIREISPNIIMIAGGLDHGERETALYNAERIREMDLSIPVIYAGNIENQDEVREIFRGSGTRLYLVDNVYPRVDVLNVEPARKVIQMVFEEHIVHGPGMGKVREMVTGSILPTPGAVMEASRLLREDIGDLMVIDVGGATTDVHSVTEGSEEVRRILLAPEPLAKRTVEGDLGVYINRGNLVDLIGKEELDRAMGFDCAPFLTHPQAVPEAEAEKRLVERLTLEAAVISVRRHAGTTRNLYGESSGRKVVAEGKDLTEVRYIIGTGGALTRLPGGTRILSAISGYGKGTQLFPGKEAEVLLDRDYIMASLGVLSLRYRESSLVLLRSSLGLQRDQKGKGE